MKLVYLASHPVQYQAPLFRALAEICDFEAWFAHLQSAAGQAAEGYAVGFDWDVELLAGYRHRFLRNVARRPSVGAFNGCNTPDVAIWLAQLRPQALVVGGWNLRSYWQAIRAARRLGIPVFARSDSQRMPGDGGMRRLARMLIHPFALRMLDGFLVAGERSYAYLRAMGIPARRLHVVPHTVDVRRFSSATAARDAKRDALGVASETVVLFVGRLIQMKRVDMLIDALADWPGGRLMVLIVGDGPLRQVLQTRAAASADFIHFLGFRNQTELPSLYAAADLLVLPSERDTWGLVVNEALAAGCCALVSPSAGCGPDMAPFSPAVETFRPATVDGLRAGLLAKLATPDPAASASSRAAAVAWFEPYTVAQKLLDAVRQTGTTAG